MRGLRRSGWLMGAAVVLPLLLFLLFQAAFAARDERRTIETAALNRSSAVIAEADAIIQRSLGALDALATADSITSGDLAGFARRARTIADQNPDWRSLNLYRASDGSEAVTLDGSRLAAPSDVGGRPGPSEARVGGIRRDGAGCPCVAIERAVPGDRVLVAWIPTERFLPLLPPGRAQYEVSAIATPEGIFVARSINHAERSGNPASRYLREAASSGRLQGIYRGVTLEGFENYTAFTRSDLTGWTAHVAIGTSYVDAPARRFLSSLGLAALLSLMLAGGLVWVAFSQLREARLLEERGQQTQKLEALGRLTGGIAHDFNNLLTPIVGALDFLARSPGIDDRARRIATGALASAGRAAKLTAQLLAFSRRQKLQLAPIDLGRMLEELRPLLEQSAGASHRVEVAVAPEPLWIRSDRNQLELALLNLVLNARDAMPEGGAIRVEAAAEGDDKVAIRVVDCGEGMSPEVAARALEPFFTTKDQGRGTGLGLAQVFGVMQQSGGEVAIDSRPGEGTTVILRLPRGAAESAEPDSRAAPSAVAAGADEACLNMLVVDDDPAVRSTIARALEEDCHSVDCLGDAEVAVAAIKATSYDLVLVDFAMPGMDGAELIRRARAVRPDCRFLMVTGYADSEAVAAACADTPILRKPVSAEELRAAVRRATGA